MQKNTISPGMELITPYIVSGPVSVEIRSSKPTSSYLLDDEGLRKWKAGENFSSFGGMLRQYVHQFSTILPSSYRWSLVIVNDDKKENVEIEHSVFKAQKFDFWSSWFG